MCLWRIDKRISFSSWKELNCCPFILTQTQRRQLLRIYQERKLWLLVWYICNAVCFYCVWAGTTCGGKQLCVVIPTPKMAPGAFWGMELTWTAEQHASSLEQACWNDLSLTEGTWGSFLFILTGYWHRRQPDYSGWVHGRWEEVGAVVEAAAGGRHCRGRLPHQHRALGPSQSHDAGELPDLLSACPEYPQMTRNMALRKRLKSSPW